MNASFSFGKTILAVALLLVASCIYPARAVPVTLPLAQEQDGGTAGRACIYVHQGRAEYRLVRASESCPAEIIVDRTAARSRS